MSRDEHYFRSLNERAVSVGAELFVGEPIPLVCECGNPRCFRLIRARVEEFEQTCARPARFLVFPGHEETDGKRIVEQNERFSIVEAA